MGFLEALTVPEICSLYNNNNYEGFKNYLRCLSTVRVNNFNNDC